MERVLVGLISDTHGVLDPQVTAVFEGVAHIVHAGDIGTREVLAALEAIAPVTAVRGNMDAGAFPWLGDAACVTVGCPIQVVHDLSSPGPNRTRDVRVVVSGHTHVPKIGSRDGVLYVNPGSPSRPRGADGPTVALLEIRDSVPHARIVRL